MRSFLGLSFLVSVLSTGCGEDAKFGQQTNRESRAVARSSGDAEADPVLQDQEETLAGASDGEPVDEPAEPTVVDVPGAPADEVDDLNKCLAKWKDVPFGPTATSYKRLVGVTVQGFGLPVNDTVATAEPQLVLVLASVNVGGAPVMNLMNPNGYYCVRVGVNVDTQLTVNIHCKAHLADPIVNVNVGSAQDGSVSQVGVDVNSEITVNTERPEGAACIR